MRNDANRTAASLALGLTLLTLAASAGAQPARGPAPRPLSKPPPAQQDDLPRLASDTVRTLKEYRASLDRLLAAQEGDVNRILEWLDHQRTLAEQGSIPADAIDQGGRTLAEAQASLDETRQWISEADHLLGEALALEELAKLPPLPIGGYVVTAAIIRYNGPAKWSLSDTPKVARFFEAAFARPLPISAAGQTPAHDRIGFDHRNALDVAVHPDSPEGRALMDFLRRDGIPFVAFRNAVPGSATGAHVHIGQPSRRVTASR